MDGGSTYGVGGAIEVFTFDCESDEVWSETFDCPCCWAIEEA